MVHIYKQIFVQKSPIYCQYFFRHKLYVAALRKYIYLDKLLTLCLRSNEHFQCCLLYTHDMQSKMLHMQKYILYS